MRDVMRLFVWALLSLSCARTIPPIVESYGALLARADTLQAGCRYDDAVTVLWQAVAADPQAIEPWLRIGSCMSRSTAPELTLRHWDRILEVRPGETEARLGRWRALADLAVGSAHEESLTSVVRREVEVCAAAIPRTEETLELACRGYQILDEDSLAAAWGAMLAFRFPGSRLAFDVAMESYYDSLYPVWNDNTGKVAFLRRYLEQNPESVMRSEAYATLAATLAALRRISELTQLLRGWVQEAPDDPRALAAAAHWHLERNLGDYRALQYARRAVDAVAGLPRPPGYPPERWEMDSCSLRALAEATYARALFRRGDIETAARMATEAVEHPPDRRRCEATTASAYVVLGHCGLASGRLDEAAVALARALQAGDVRHVWTVRADSLLRVVLSRMHSSESPLEHARSALSYAGPVFEDITVPAGLAGVNGGRVAWGDYDDDGLDDLLVGGTRLFRNSGGGHFEDVTVATGLAGSAASGGLLADFNNDGRLDLVSTGSGRESLDRLLLFDGTTFQPVAGFPADSLPTEGAGLGDFDGDGLLDIYFAKYEVQGSLGGGLQDRLLMNRGDGLFEDETASRGLGAVAPRAGRGVSCADFDNDGDLDIFVSNYRLHRNFLWVNDGSGHFTEVACALGVRGVERDGWFGHTIGSDWGDFDGDGDLDLVSANLAHPRYIHFSNTTTVLQNRLDSGDGFADVAADVGIPFEETLSDPCWADFDNDGDLDLYLTSVYEGRRSYLLLWDGERFQDATYLAGVRAHNGWGCAVSDMDNDGDLDLAVGSASGVRLFRNDTQGHSVRIACLGNGTSTNSSCIGCRVTVTDGRTTQVREVQGGKGTTSGNSLTQHFGMSRSATHFEVTVRFADGEIRSVPGMTSRQTVHVFQ